MRRAVLPLVVLSVGLLAAPGRAAGPPDPDAPGLTATERLDRLFERVRLEQAGIRTLAADFVQEKESDLFVDPEVARGRFAYRAPDRVRWTYLEPDPMEVVLDDREMVTWYRSLGRVDRVAVGRYADQVLKYLGASGSLETLKDYFTVRVTFPSDPAEPYRLQLRPRYERIAKRLAGMTIWVDHARFLPVRLRYEEPGGDVTEYRFENLRVNAELPDDTFRLELPDDVTVRTIQLDRLGS